MGAGNLQEARKEGVGGRIPQRAGERRNREKIVTLSNISQ